MSLRYSDRMEIRLVIFLAFTTITLILNTVLVLIAYKAFAKFAGGIRKTMRVFESDSATRTWIATVHSASEQALAATETAKEKLVQCDSVMHRAQSRYEFALAKVDTRMAGFEKKMLESTERIKEKVEGPAHKFATVAMGIRGVAAKFASEE